MNALPFLSKNNRTPYRFYFWVVFVLTLSMVTYVFPEELDITRYYENATLALQNFPNVIDYATNLFETQIDFIYSSSLYLAGKNGIHMNVVTIFYMSLYYIAIFEVLRKHFFNIRISGAIFFYVAMFAPFIWVQSIARNFAAIAFFYVFINCLLDGKNIKAVFWLIVSVFTHISMLMYLPVILVSFLLNRLDFNKKIIYLSIVAALVFSYIVPSQLLNLMSIVMEGDETRYGAVYGSLETQGALMSNSIGYGDKIPIVFCLIYSVLLLFLRQNKDFMYWMLYVLTLMLSFFILSSLMFTNRVIMLMTLFIAYNAYSVISEGKYDSKKKLYLASIIGCVVVLLHFYSYRTHFSLL